MKTLLLTLSTFICANFAMSQVANFTFDQQLGSYVEITGGTLVAAATGISTNPDRLQNQNFPNQPLPFTFTFSGSPYTEFNINTNGFITFGATLPAGGTTSTAISGNTGYEGSIVPFNAPTWGVYGGDADFTSGSNVLTNVTHFDGVVIGKEILSFFGSNLPAGTTVTAVDPVAGTITVSNPSNSNFSGAGFLTIVGEIRTQTLGVSPNRIHVIQWKNFGRSGGTSGEFGTLVNVQIRLHETTNKIEYVYGLCGGAIFNWSPRVGMRGVNNSDYQTRRNDGARTWLTSDPGNSNNWDMTFTASKLPNNGLTYTWEQPMLPADDVGVFAAMPSNGVQIITPGDITATVRNFGSNPQSNIEVFYRYSSDGGMTFSSPVGPVIAPGPINTNQNENVLFTGANAFNPAVNGNYLVKIYTSLMGDEDNSNDTTTRTYMAGRINSFPYFTDFEDVTGYTRSGLSSLWFHSIGTDPSGNLSETWAASYFSFSSTTPGFLRTPEMDFTGLTNPMLSFYVAYRTYQNENDRLRIAVSTNGGSTFEYGMPDYFDKSFNSVPSLATLPPSTSFYTVGNASEWRHEIVDLSDYAGMSNVMVAFVGISAFGNNGYIDYLKISNADNFSFITVNSPGTYGSLMTDGVQVTFTALRPMGSNSQSGTHKSGVKEIYDASNDVVFGPYDDEEIIINRNIQKQTGGITITTDNPDASSGILAILSNNEFPVNNTYQTNLTATTFNGAIYTPDVIADRYWEIAFSGDDYISTSTYDIIIDISTQQGVTAYDSLYIVKRVDQNSPWVCLNTITEYDGLNPVRLRSNGLTGFSQFGIASADGTLPVDLISFSSIVNNRDVTLNWTTAWEESNMRFDVQRRPVILSGSEESIWNTVGSVAGSGTVYEERHYSYTDKNLVTGKYEYRLVQIDFDGNSTSDHNLTNTVEIGVPNTFSLSQNYPNPFNPVTQIGFEIPVESFVKLAVYDITGREVAVLVNDKVTPGYHSTEFNAATFGSGIYFYRMIAGSSVITKKMLLVK